MQETGLVTGIEWNAGTEHFISTLCWPGCRRSLYHVLRPGKEKHIHHDSFPSWCETYIVGAGRLEFRFLWEKEGDALVAAVEGCEAAGESSAGWVLTDLLGAAHSHRADGLD